MSRCTRDEAKAPSARSGTKASLTDSPIERPLSPRSLERQGGNLGIASKGKQAAARRDALELVGEATNVTITDYHR